MTDRNQTTMIVEAEHRPVVNTIKQLADELNVSEALVRLEIRRGFLHATRFGARILIRREEINRYLAEREAV